MRFEREINIYGDEVILKRFQANETSIEVVQGKISALISESELIELENSQATMYSKLASAIMDIDSLQLNFSELNTKYNTVSGQYTQLDSKLTHVEISVSGLSANISQVSRNLSNNYSTTRQMNSAIDAKANQISASVSSTYATKSALNTANGKIDELETWKSEASLKITDSAIISTVISSTRYESSVESIIEQNASSIRLKADNISWESRFSSMTALGELTCDSANLTGIFRSTGTDGEMTIYDGTFRFTHENAWLATFGEADHGDLHGLRVHIRDGFFTITGDEGYMKFTYANKTTGSYSANTLNAGCNLDMHGFSILNSSDERLKTNIREIKARPLDLLMDIDLFQYEWVDSGNHVDVGVLAQQLNEIIPSITNKGENDIYSINYIGFIPYIIGAIQDIYNMINPENRKEKNNYRPNQYSDEEIQAYIFKNAPQKTYNSDEEDGNDN